MLIKKILHLTGLRELGSGQRQQLVFEKKASNNLSSVQWDTIAIHSGKSVQNFEYSIPKYMDFLVLRNAYFWFFLLKESKKYDLVLMRHITFDPFALIFSPFIKNRISVHHSKEIEELKHVKSGWKGFFASNLEQITGRFSLKNSLCIAGVTQEIADYENTRGQAKKQTFVLPNGIEVNSVNIANDNRESDRLNILFMCSYFAEWHGLDILLNSVKTSTLDYDYHIHLVGNLSKDQLQFIAEMNNSNIIIHNSLSMADYYKVASKCNIGLGSLAMFRNNLNEGSTLKVREMLAMGLPVYSGHKDVAFEDSFKYYQHTSDFSISNLINFAIEHKETSRTEVRLAASPFIEKENIMHTFIKQLQSNLFKNKL